MDGFVAYPSECAFPVRVGNTATPLIDGVETFGAIGTAVSKARRCVWVAISFWEPEFQLNGLPWLEALERTGLEIRLLFWEPGHDKQGRPNPIFSHVSSALQNRLRPGKFQVRFDSSGTDIHHCVHEKTWIVDAFEPYQVAFTGGLVLNRTWMTDQRHLDGRKHDIYVQLEGSGSSDVSASFAQRWNASNEQKMSSLSSNSFFSTNIDVPSIDDSLPPLRQGAAIVQVQRDIAPNRYGMAQGEASIYRQLELAIARANSTIYIEQQHIAYAPMLRLLQAAMRRGVKVVYVVPFVLLQQHLPSVLAKPWLLQFLSRCVSSVAARKIAAGLDRVHRWLCPRHFHCGESMSSYEDVFLNILPQLATENNFCLAALASETNKSVYVHSKLIIVDDDFYSIGSANCVDLSYDRLHTELAVSVFEPGLSLSLFSLSLSLFSLSLSLSLFLCYSCRWML